MLAPWQVEQKRIKRTGKNNRCKEPQDNSRNARGEIMRSAEVRTEN
jgi:hypothetical protein